MTIGAPLRVARDATPLRVALDATPLLGRPTGVGVFCHGALGALAGVEGVDVSAFAVSWRRRGQLTELVPDGVTVRQRAMPARPLHAAWKRWEHPALERFVGTVDVVHGTNFVVPPTRRAARVVTVHDLTPVRFPEFCDGPTLGYPALVRRALRAGAWVHTPSAFVAEEVADLFGAPPERVCAVPSGVPPLPDAVGRGVAQLVPPGTEAYVLALGTAEPRKDLPGLVAAFDLLAGSHPGVSLVLAGPPGWGEEALGAAVRTSPFSSRIARTGWVADAEAAVLIRGAAVLAYPSIYEGFGFPPLQAMAHGVPVVATDTGALPEVLGDGALLVKAGDREALAEGLRTVLDSPDVRAALRTKGAARAASFTWQRCAAGLSDLYRHAASATSAIR